MARSKKLFVTTTDIGGTEAVLPVLRALRSLGSWDIAALGTPETPANKLYRENGFEPRTLESYGYGSDVQAMRNILVEEGPSLVLVGVACEDASTDRVALAAAQQEHIPNVAICESWPDTWLSILEERDGPIYRRADALVVCDQVAHESAVAHGFDPKRALICGNPADDELAVQRERLRDLRVQRRRTLGIPEDDLVVAWFGTYDLDNPEHRGSIYEGYAGYGEAEAYRAYLWAMREAVPLAKASGHRLSGLFRQKPSYGRFGLLRIDAELGFCVPWDTYAVGGNVPTIAACDVICSLVGGISLGTAAKLGVPGVFYRPGATLETDDQVTNRLGITKPLYELGALREFILRIAHDPSELDRLRASLRPVKIEPGATDRVIRELERLVST